MDIEKQIAQCIELCQTLQRQIERNSQVPPGGLGGAMLYAYEEVRASQLGAIQEIYRRLRILEGRADSERKNLYK